MTLLKVSYHKPNVYSPQSVHTLGLLTTDPGNFKFSLWLTCTGIKGFIRAALLDFPNII